MTSSGAPRDRTTPNLVDENEARYKILTESLPQYVWTTDAEGKIDYCNRHFLDEVQAGRVLESVHPEDVAGLLEKVEQSRATGRPFEHEYRVRRASDGEYRWHFAHSEQFTDSTGERRWLGLAMDVTSRMQAELKLRDANERLNGILNSISEWFIVLDRDWRIRFASQRVLDFTHRDWSDLQGRPLWDAFPEAAKTEYKPGYEKVMRERVAHTFEVNYPQPDGSISQYQVHAYPTPDGVAALISNTTEKRKTDIELAEGKRLLHLVLDSAGVGTWMWNLGTNEITDLAGTANLLGIAQITSLDQLLLVTHPKDREAVEAALTEARNTGRLESEHRIVMPDGSLRRIRAVGSLLREQKGFPLRIACVLTDVTDRNRSDEVRNRLAAIVDSSDDAIISKDLDGIVTSWNAGATQLFGYRPEEMIGKSILTIIPPELHAEEPAIIASLRSGKKIDHYETLRIRKDGTRVKVSLTISPVRDSSGHVVGASKIARDISERLRMQEAMIQSEKLAATGRMAAAIAHEINNPLEAVTNLAYLLSTDPTLNETARNHAERLLEEINRVSDVAKQSLGFFRDNKKPGSFDVCALLDNVVSLYRPLLDQKKVRLDRDYTGSCRIFGSSSEIRQVLTNLLRNAIEAVEPGGVIQLRMRQTHSGKLRILVADNGHGISPQTRSRLFQPFVTSKGAAGNGLGLWVSQGIIAKHSGRIQVKTCDIPGRSGTVFAVMLPADTGEKSQDSTRGAPAIFAIPRRLAS